MLSYYHIAGTLLFRYTYMSQTQLLDALRATLRPSPPSPLAAEVPLPANAETASPITNLKDTLQAKPDAGQKILAQCQFHWHNILTCILMKVVPVCLIIMGLAGGVMGWPTSFRGGVNAGGCLGMGRGLGGGGGGRGECWREARGDRW